MCRKAPWGSKRRGHHPRIGDAKALHRTGLFPHLGKKLHMHVGEGPRAGQRWKKKLDSWPRVSKDPEEMPHINDLTTSSLSPSSIRGVAGWWGIPHPLFAGMPPCLASVLTK